MPHDVLILTPRLDTIGGVENYYNALQLHRDDARIHYFPITGPGQESLPQLATRLLRIYWQFWNRLRSNSVKLVVLNPTLDARSFYRDAIFCWLAHARKRRVIVFFRGWSATFEKKILSSYLRRKLFETTYARSHDFIVLGRLFEQKLRNMGCHVDSRFWLETTVADSTYLSHFSISTRVLPTDRLRLLFLARLTPTKGAGVALRAFQIAQQLRPDLRLELFIAGAGPELPKLQALVNEHNIQGVTLCGPVRERTKADLLLSSHVLILPTTAGEGMPNSVLEAMLYGMPVLATKAGSIPEVVVHGQNGFLSSTPDPQLFSDWIIELAANNQLRARMAQTNHQQALRLYTSMRVRSRLMAIIDACMPLDQPDGTPKLPAPL